MYDSAFGDWIPAKLGEKMKIARLLLYVACVLVGYSMFVMFSACWHAVSLADGKPFCIQVPAERGYKPLSSIFELAGIYNRINSADTALNHAVLIVGELKEDPLQRYDWPLELYHWSNLFNKFEPGAYAPADSKIPAIYCQPRVKYFANLEKDEPRNPEKLTFYYGGRHWAIPHRYNPRVIWEDGAGISIDVCLPTLDLVRKSRCNEKKDAPVFVSVRFRVAYGLNKKPSNASDPEIRIKQSGIEFGLEKIQVWRSSKRFELAPDYVIYSAYNDANDLQAEISCAPDMSSCWHNFLFENILLRMLHSGAEVRAWRETQSYLTTLVHSFLATPKFHSSK